LFVYNDVSTSEANKFSLIATRELNRSFFGSGIKEVVFSIAKIIKVDIDREKSEYYSNPQEIINRNINSRKFFYLKKQYHADIIIYIKKTSFALTMNRLDLRRSNPLLFLSGVSYSSSDWSKPINSYSLRTRHTMFLRNQIVVNLGFTESHKRTVVHEVGHLFGLAHGHESDGVYSFSKGFAVKNSFATVMCYGNLTNSKEISLFSGPDVFYNGIRMGDTAHDSVRTIKLIAPRMKMFSNSI